MAEPREVETSVDRKGRLSAVLDRYRPVALAVTAIALVSSVLPGAAVISGDSTAAVPRLPFAGSDAPTPDLASAQQPVEQQIVAASNAADLPVRFGGGDSSASSSFSSSAFSGSGTSSDVSTSDSSTSFDTSDSEATAAPVRQPLRLGVTAWASRSAGTPVASLGVPEKSLPVGNRGTMDKASYVRLQGDESVLVLKEHAGGSRGNPATGTVQACQITVNGWAGGEAKSFSDAPAYDAGSCVAGTRAETGEWRFDLSKFATPTDDRGFALVPAANAPADFQVAFATS